MTILTIFFFITAILYSSVGFGGGSTYLAVMVFWGWGFSPSDGAAEGLVVVEGGGG